MVNVKSTHRENYKIILFGLLAFLIGCVCFACSSSLAFADDTTADASTPVLTTADENATGTEGDTQGSTGTGTSTGSAGDQSGTTAGTTTEGAGNGSSAGSSAGTGSDTPVVSKPVAKPTKAGWMKDTDGTWYYFKSASAALSTGWLKLGKTWYYLDPAENGAMAKNEWKTINGKSYYFGDSGAMKTGWIKIGSDWYYATSSGAKVTNGWIKSGGKWYWLQGDLAGDEKGKMAANQWITDKGKQYFLTSSGAMKTGWVANGSDYYYTNSSGAKVTNGWIKSGGKWYWLQGDLAGAEQGKMFANATKTIAGKLYSFDSSGAMRANCTIDLGDGTARFASSSGAISRIGIYEDGKLVLTNSEGTKLSGWQKLAGKWFYGAAGTGVAHKGWLKLGKTWYYFNSSYAMVTGTQRIDGKVHLFNSSGAWLGSNAMATKAQGYSSGSKWLILVNRGAHQVGIFSGSKGNWNLEKLMSCVTGAPGSQTITGVFTTNGSKRMNLSTDSRARWCTNIAGGYFFHTILASTSELGHSLSHGCIRLAVPDAQWIYNNIGRGTTVVIYN